MPANFFQRNPQLLALLSRWWIFWLGYGFLPSILTQQVGHFSNGYAGLWLLSSRLFVLVGGYFLISTREKGALKQALVQPVTGRTLLQLLGLFGAILVLGMLSFTLVEQALHLPVQQTIRQVGENFLGQGVMVVLLAPLVEEAWFRHWLLGRVSSNKDALLWWGFMDGWQDVASIILFGLLHFSADYWGMKAFIWASVMGFFLLWVRRSTGSLTACIGLHALHNGVLFFNG
jgi:membrane protease YdiL (CAAX protease family)